MIDMFSKFVIVRAIQDAKVRKTVEFLRNDVFMKYGMPEMIISENGPQLRSEVFTSFLSEFHVKYWLSAGYRVPTTQAETTIGTILATIQSHVVNTVEHVTWDAHIDELTFALNSFPHAMVRCTPHYVVFGQASIRDGKEYEIFERGRQEERWSQIEEIREEIAVRLKRTNDVNERRSDACSIGKVKYELDESVARQNGRWCIGTNYHAAEIVPKRFPRETFHTETLRR